MVKLKYSPGEIPKRNEHSGYTFQTSRIGQTAMSGQKNDRNRNVRQINRKLNLMKAVTNWRNMDPATQANWNLFAATYPQATRANPAVFLTGYQLFIKRSQYLFLNNDINEPFLEAPLSEVLTLDTFTFTIDQTENCIDVTDLYIRSFGLIPMPGQFLLIKVLPYSAKSGQFFPIITQTIEILESYIDGLFVSLHLPANLRDIIFSVYLSKPIHQSTAYQGTKTRYMGCFTTKTFLELTDTPDSYTGQAGKIVKVKADETGLEFGEGGSGGLTCETIGACIVIEEMNNAIDDLIDDVALLEQNKIGCSDLPSCPTIISMTETDNKLIDIVTSSGMSSYPTIKYGAIYHGQAVRQAANIANTGYRVATEADWDNLIAYAGGIATSNNILKEKGTTYWSNNNGLNTLLFNLRGNGFRSGSFMSINVNGYYFTSTVASASRMVGYRFDNAGSAITKFVGTYTAMNNNVGGGIRIVKESTSLANGQFGVYTGNDGKKYRTLCINGLEWTTDNVNETLWRTLAQIPIVTDQTLWNEYNRIGMCWYNNNPLYG